MVVRFYSSVAPPTTLSGSIDPSATSIQVGSTTGFPAFTPYTLSLSYDTMGEELVQVDSAGGTTLMVTRGIDGTSATSHNAGVEVRHVSSARDFADSRGHENSDDGIHGLDPGDVLVGEDKAQALSNKTLIAPVITDPTITGTQSGNLTYAGESTYTGARAIRIPNAADISPTSTDHGFQIGPDDGANIRMDGNEIMRVTDGVPGNLILNANGGTVSAFDGQSTDSVVDMVTVNGVVDANVFQSGRASTTASSITTKADADAVNRLTIRADGLHSWGDGTASSDTNLFRGAANQLRTNDDLVVDGDVTVSGTLISDQAQRADGIEYRATQTGTHLENFIDDSANTSAIVFPVPFTAKPIVSTNINSGSGTTARWGSRAINITATGFDLFVFSGDGAASTWSNIELQWVATAIT